jgi:hypothetical protein
MIHPSTHLALARERQADLLREARTRELARTVAPEKGPGLLARLSAFARRRPAARPAAQPS